MLCTICKGNVPAGEGILRREGSGWSFTHTGACPRGIQDDKAARYGHAQEYARRIMRVLRRTDVEREEILGAVDGLSALVQTRWMSADACERILLGSPALSGMDRLEAQRIVQHLLLETSNA